MVNVDLDFIDNIDNVIENNIYNVIDNISIPINNINKLSKLVKTLAPHKMKKNKA